MPKQKILIVAPSDDLHARAVAHELSRHRVDTEWVDLSALNCGVRLTLSLGDNAEACLTTLDGRPVQLSEISTVWWRRPKLPEVGLEFNEDVRAFVRGEWEHLIEGLEAFAPVRWVNPPAANRLAGRKSYQLIAARAEGLEVPRTVLTNDPEKVLGLVDDGVPLIYKRIGAAPRPLTATKEFLPEDLERLGDLGNCPAIFQERIAARLDVRVTAIGSELWAVEIESQSGESPLDWRFDHTVPFRIHKLDQITENKLHSLMIRLGLSYAAIDLRLTPEGEYVFLEANPGGQFLFVELLANVPLSEQMALFLSG